VSSRFVALRPLRHRDFALLWWASAVSNVGTWVQTVAVGALVASRTGRASWAALVAAAAFLPIGVLAPVGGALADRLDRRFWLALSNVAQGLLAVALAVLSATGHASALAVTGVSFLTGCVTAVAFPFQMAMIPDLVPKEELLAASSLGSAQFNLGRVLGPALAGVVIAATSYTWAFVVNAVSFGTVIAALVVMRVPPQVQADGAERLWRGIKSGARVAVAEPGCRVAIGLITVVALLASPFIALIPAKAVLLASSPREVASVTSTLTTAQGVGAVVGALLLAPLAARLGRRRALLLDVVLVCAALGLYGYAPGVVLASVALGLVGLAYIGVLSGLSTVVQLRAPAAYRARVLSIYFVALGVVYPVGAVIQGAAADRFTLARTTAGAAAVLVALVVALRVVRPRALEELDGDEPAEIVPAEPVPAEPIPAT
jgi:MFS family permease